MLKDTVVTGNEQDKGQRNVRWQEIDWKKATQIVSQLQSRIVKAEQEGDSTRAQRLRNLLLHSFSAKILAVRRVVSNRGKRTPGVNPVIRGWANHFKHVASKKRFNALQDYIWKRLWHWARRRHPNKTGRWVKSTYFTTVAGNHGVFTDRKGKTIFNPAKVPILRHGKIRKDCNPYDRDWEESVEQRVQRLAKESMSRKAISLWMRQKGVCPWCKGDLDVEHQHIHHIVYRCHGGKDTLDNLWLMHDVCQRQLHAHSKDETEAGGLVERLLMKA